MAKRFAVTFFIVLGSCLFLLAVFVIVLFLAPGLSIFGLRYIAGGSRVGNFERQSVSEYLKINDNEFTGTFILETNEIPVNIIFTEKWIYEVEYYEDFNGLTKSDIDYPSISIDLDRNGSIVIKTDEFKKFVYESNSSKRYLNLYIPLAATTGETSEFRTSLTIDAGSSDINFSKVENYDLRDAEFDLVKIKTTGKVTYETHVYANTFDFETDNSIFVKEDRASIVDATNYYLKSTNGRIRIERAVEGDIEAETYNFDISLVSCKNLTATSNYGDVNSSKEGQKVNVSGLVTIKTKAGGVYLGDVLGEYGTSKITTGAGNVEIDKIENVEITTTRGHIEIVSANEVKVSTNMGNVEIQEVLTSCNIETKRSKVNLGGRGMRINNPTVFSRLGRVNIASASGEVNIHTISSDINFTNYDSQNITIVSGGELEATGLTGKVKITATEDSSISFSDISDGSSLEFGENAKLVTINALNDTVNDIRYIITGSKIETYEDNGTGTFSKIVETNNTLSSMNGSGPLLEVKAPSAVIKIYFKAS